MQIDTHCDVLPTNPPSQNLRLRCYNKIVIEALQGAHNSGAVICVYADEYTISSWQQIGRDTVEFMCTIYSSTLRNPLTTVH